MFLCGFIKVYGENMIKCKRCNDLGVIWADLSESDCPECNHPVINFLNELIEKEEEDERYTKKTV